VIMCNDMTSSQVESKSCHQLFATANHDVIADSIHMNNTKTSDVTEALTPWSASHDVSLSNKLHSNLRIQRATVVEDTLKDEKSCRVTDDNNMATATRKKSKCLLNDTISHEQSDDDVSFCHYDNRSEYIKQYRQRRKHR